ncbi:MULTISPECIES: efflux RND transporter periplasmic adaptor subunit [Acidovorax]|uniref:Efflux RND transporter periplasmic adaptor subunit n=1 Tax=Acidovorax facilis TaxID=12917 RepID=A0ABV8DB96_9BURK|nr:MULTISPECIES: efflux RND transporter periplasmic adaptor subunit [Acidovorax]KQB60067.1 RND transporter [Acidovorax sp. SD340]MBO1010638.1 efflux RND transporter periplasmic adaptor subunit [Acidovorax sp. SD340]MCO4244665.1 efflux RND transporter periplasmic adaptor subunit [Acidovorax facilis]
MKSLTLLTAALSLAVSGAWAAGDTTAQPVTTFTVKPATAQLASSVDAQVEAVRDATLSAQVQGAVISLSAKAGDRVTAGQELARIDARAAQQNAAASAAQVDAARAAQNVATKEYERQKQLFQKQYIGQAALDRAEAQWRASQSQVQALLAQAGAAATQSGFYVIKAPFAGVVGHVPATLGDMAMPGKPLMTVYDPSLMRVTAYVGQQQAATLREGGTGELQVEIPGVSASRIAVPASKVQVLPTVDAQSHTVQVRVELPTSLVGVAPGMFARLWLDAAKGTAAPAAAAVGPLLVPASVVVRRAEMTGVYVLDGQGRPLLRQVRLGRPAGDMVEVLSGVRAGDRIALQPQAAAKVR